jgi:hypothetical protein
MRRSMSIGGWFATKTAPYVVPVILVIMAFPVATVIHFTIARSAAWVAIAAILATLTTGMTFVTWGKRHKHTQTIMTVFTGSVLGWVLFAGVGTPWSRNMVTSWVVGGLFLCVAWGIRHAANTPASDQDKGESAGGVLMGKVQSLKNGREVKVESSEKQVRARVQLKQGEDTAEGIQHDRGTIASAVGMGKEEVKVVPVRGREDQVDLVFTPGTNTAQVIKYQGPFAFRESIATHPVYLGKRSDGSDILWWIVGDPDEDNPRPLAMTICTGMTGAGKTETLCTGILEMKNRTDVVVIVADPAKFAQSFGDIADAIDIAAKTKSEVMTLISNLPALVEYRAGLMGSLTRLDGGTGYKQWEPECYTVHGIPAVFIDIEEAADVASMMDEELDEAVRKLRSIGVHLCLSMQTVPHDNLSRKTRGQFGQALVHGVKEMQDAKFSLSPGTLEAGADPTKWGNNAPGSLYAEVVGTDPSLWSEDGRAIKMSYEQKRESITNSKEFWASFDPGSKAILSRGIALQDEQFLAGLPGIQENDDEEYDDEINLVTRTDKDGEEVNIENEITSQVKSKVVFGPDAVDETPTEEARELVEEVLVDLEQRGRLYVEYSDVAEIPEQVGRTRQWVYGEFKRLVKEGRLIDTNGRPPYRIKPRVEYQGEIQNPGANPAA